MKTTRHNFSRLEEVMSKEQSYRILRYDEKSFIVKSYLENEFSISDLASQYQIGESTLRGWLQKIDYNIDNIEKLKRRTSHHIESKRRIITGLPSWVELEILAQVKTHPGMGALKLKQHFYRHHQTVLSEKKIYFFLKERGILQDRSKPRKQAPGHTRRFEYPHPLAAVQLDLLTIQLSSKSKIYLVTFLDDYSRYVLSSQFIKSKTMDNVTGKLLQTIKVHGLMERIICDKGSEFVSWQSFTDFEEKLCSLDIELISSGPETPQKQGKIERWHRSYREECEGKLGGFDSYSQAQYETDRYVNYYNYERVHQGIGGLVPADRYYGLSEDIERELSQYHKGNHAEKCIYFSCNINGRRLVVSGPRSDALTIYQNTGQDGKEKEAKNE